MIEMAELLPIKFACPENEEGKGVQFMQHKSTALSCHYILWRESMNSVCLQIDCPSGREITNFILILPTSGRNIPQKVFVVLHGDFVYRPVSCCDSPAPLNGCVRTG